MAVYGVLLESSGYYFGEIGNFDSYFDESYDVLNEGTVVEKIKELWDKFKAWVKKVVNAIKEKIKALKDKLSKKAEGRYAIKGIEVRIYDTDKAIILPDKRMIDMMVQIQNKSITAIDNAMEGRFDKSKNEEIKSLTTKLDDLRKEFDDKVDKSRSYKPEKFTIDNKNKANLISRVKENKSKFDSAMVEYDSSIEKYNGLVNKMNAKIDKLVAKTKNDPQDSTLLSLQAVVRSFIASVNVCVMAINVAVTRAQIICTDIDISMLALDIKK